MTDIQRYVADEIYPQRGPVSPDDYVTYSDHVEALRAAEQRERERILNDWSLGQMQGNSNGEWILNVVRQKNYERGLGKAREAVASMPYDEPEDDPQSREHEVEVRQRYLAAIDGISGGDSHDGD